MIIVLRSKPDVNSYLEDCAKRRLKLPMVCPKCYGKTHHHGNYHRKVWLGGHEVILIKVFRTYCPRCKVTISHPPAFLLKGYVTAKAVIEQVIRWFRGNTPIRAIVRMLGVSRRTVQRYLKRCDQWLAAGLIEL
ncbi:MAG: DUF6431 domain-containing protein [Limnochordia bacterium]|jgi:transposase-like protein|nr:helix-turn-helix domain-containing protein [Bacillota bacterium]